MANDLITNLLTYQSGFYLYQLQLNQFDLLNQYKWMLLNTILNQEKLFDKNQLLWPQSIFLWKIYSQNNNTENKSECISFLTVYTTKPKSKTLLGELDTIIAIWLLW